MAEQRVVLSDHQRTIQAIREASERAYARKQLVAIRWARLGYVSLAILAASGIALVVALVIYTIKFLLF